MIKLRYITCLVLIILIVSCKWRKPEKEMQRLADLYESKKITNIQMLLEMGKIYRDHANLEIIKTDYFNRMIISGYTSWALHQYLANPEIPINDTDKKLILFALTQGNHYNLAKEFISRFNVQEQSKLMEIILINDSLSRFTQMIGCDDKDQGYSMRGNLFARIGEMEMASFDLDRALGYDPCNAEVLFRKALVLFEKEQIREISRMLDGCNSISPKPDWFDIFYQVASEAENIEQSSQPFNNKLFKLANLYVNNGFNELALRKSKKLLETEGNNSDYLALQAFIYYRLGNREKALQFISEAENLSGQKSKLRQLIEQMNEL